MTTAASKQDEAAIAFKLLRTEVSTQKLSTQYEALSPLLILSAA